MNFLSRRKARKLLQNENDTTLTPQEQQLLQTYEQTDEGQTYAALHRQLSTWQPEMDNHQFDYQRMRQATHNIDREVQRQRRTRRNWKIGQTVMGITAVFALIIISIGWLQTRNQVGLETTLSQPIVTATPPAGMDSVDLRTMNPYYNGRTIAKAEERAEFPLHIPTWLVSDTIFKAADYYAEANSVELLSAQRKSNGNWGAIWILGQAELTPDTTGKQLPIFFNPFSISQFDIEPIAQQEITIAGEPAIFEQEFWSISNGFYGYNVSRVSWEADGKRFLLTIMNQEEDYIEASTMVEYITNMRLEQAEPTQ